MRDLLGGMIDIRAFQDFLWSELSRVIDLVT